MAGAEITHDEILGIAYAGELSELAEAFDRLPPARKEVELSSILLIALDAECNAMVEWVLARDTLRCKTTLRLARDIAYVRQNAHATMASSSAG